MAELTMDPGYAPTHRPDKAAVIMAGSGETVTYGQLDERSKRVAQLLFARGLRPGDHVAILLENHPRTFELIWAALRSGLYYTPVNWHLSPAEAAYIVNDCGARALFASRHLAEIATGVLATCPQVESALMIDGAIEGFEPYEEVIAGYPAEPLEHEEEGANMPYSSGTTGWPKGIKRPLAQVPFGSGNAHDHWMSQMHVMDDHTVYLSPAPLYHTAPNVWTIVVQRVGGTVVVLERFDPEQCLGAIERYHVDVAQFVPTMFVRMLKLPPEVRARYDISSLRRAIHAAAPCPVHIKAQMIEWWGPVVYEFYGASEGGYVAIEAEEWLQHKGSVGKPALVPVHILGDDGTEVPTGESGTIYFDWPQGFEYHNDRDKTAGAFAHGWFTVGDVGYIDEEGYLFLTDRKTNMIISGGVNIYPQETENILLEHPKVADAAVIGVPNEELGEEVKAVVQLMEPGDAGPELAAELIAFCRDRLTHYKCPRSVDFDPDLPRLPTGKLLKRVIRDRYWGTSAKRI